jgi:hypothetical protein
MKGRALVMVLALAAPFASGAPPAAQATPKPAATPAAQTPQQPAPQRPATAVEGQTQEPSEATLGVPFYAGMRFIESLDAGSGQRFYLFGTTAGFADVVAFYRSALKLRGDLVFEEPPTHQFDIGKFREETMAFPPSITVKDYTWGGMQGYPNPRPGAEPASFKTIVQVVPIPAAPGVKR